MEKGAVIVSYRGIASLLENLERPSPADVSRAEAEDELIVARAKDDPMADLGAPQQPHAVLEFAAAENAPPPELDELQILAMWNGLRQAVVEIAKADKTPGVLFAVDHRAASLLQSFLAERGESLEKLQEVQTDVYEVQFDDRDISGWVGSFFSDWYKRIRKRPFIAGSREPRRIANATRIALMGDWGTGLYSAPRSSQTIAESNPAFDVIIHLGDIYYAGNEKEVTRRFLNYWPRVGDRAMSLAVNANHEMYSGGEGYFGKLLPALKQPSSVFALQNDHFLIVGLDTGWDEHDLAGDQVQWLDTLVRQAGSRKIVLLSHHQPFSVFESQGTALVKKLRPLLTAGRIFAWYWGHEHRCMIYGKHPAWRMYGRLIGHSGYPYFRKDFSRYPIAQANRDGSTWRGLAGTDMAPPSVILDGENPWVREAPKKYGPQGWASIHLDGPRLLERVHAPDGTVLHELELT
ncbi:MAG: hypothetical protein HOW73_19390 [Polyangiaceae bacterium]|nr:hypothetical protein [Polyangiaceae bacterium]